MTLQQEVLKEKHGTPEEFAAAVWQAFENLYVTHDEAVAAIQKYRDEWNKAGQ